MDGKQNKTDEHIEKLDLFSKMMFGDRPHGRRNIKASNEEKEEHTEQSLDLEKQSDTYAKERNWLFGNRQDSHQKNSSEPFNLFALGNAKGKEAENGSILDLLQNVDYMELMEHFDTLMTSANQLKPLIKKIKPFVETFLNKK